MDSTSVSNFLSGPSGSLKSGLFVMSIYYRI